MTWSNPLRGITLQLSRGESVSYLSYTSQVKDFLLYSESKGLSFELVVRENTVLSNTIRSLVTEGRVVIVRLLPGR